MLRIRLVNNNTLKWDDSGTYGHYAYTTPTVVSPASSSNSYLRYILSPELSHFVGRICGLNTYQ